MSLKCGIVGLPNVGKSTLFNCISSGKAQAANFPFCTIEPNIGSTTVPDPRLQVLESLVHPKRVVPATVEIVDIAGLVKGASKGEGLGNQFLANIRETDAILHVLRCFDDPNVTHVDGSVDPVRDKEIIDLELQLKDLETVESRLGKLQKQATGGDKHAKKACEILTRYREALLAGKSARTVALENPEEEKIAHEFFLLTAKPVLYVCNVDEASAAGGNAYVDRVREAVAGENAGVLVIAAKIESGSACAPTSPPASPKSAPGPSTRATRLPAPPESSIPTSRKASSAPKSSSTTISSSTAPKPNAAPPASSPSRARTTSSRTETSCTSSSTCSHFSPFPLLPKE